MEETIGLKELFLVLRKRMLMIVAITFIASLISGIVSFYFITPIYETSTQILVNQKKDKAFYQPGEVQTNLQLVNTYNVIIKSPAILDQVKERLALSLTTEELTKKITVASQKDSQVMLVTVQDKDPLLARDIANTTAAVFKDEIFKIMSIDNVAILAKATVTDRQSPVKPRPILNIMIAFALALMVSVGVAFLLEYLDNTLKSEQDIENILGLPVLGVISQMDDSKRGMTAQAAKVREQVRGS